MGILDGGVYYSAKEEKPADSCQKTTHADQESYARANLLDGIVMPLCIPHQSGTVSSQDMTNSKLVGYLYERSKWIEEVLTFARSLKGGDLEFPIGESSEFFSHEDLQRFGLELSRIPEPGDPKLKREFENLRELFKIASSHPDLTLVMSVV